ncbi:hypothetical protein M407DRAFT_83536, partial [Tulasnella calospora MUT 4182]
FHFASARSLTHRTQRIKRETAIWKAAEHPNILHFIGYQTVDGAPLLVSQWCRNGNLSAYLSRQPNITLLCHAARGLLHLHTLTPPIVHGNVKPENVIVLDDLQVALSDFGASKLNIEQHTGLTTSGLAGGSSGYQAKELLNEDSATPATDVYAFGGLILAAMSGKQPFWKRKANAIIIAVYNDQTPAPEGHPQLPRDDPLWELLIACWSGDAERRPLMSEVLETAR